MRKKIKKIIIIVAISLLFFGAGSISSYGAPTKKKVYAENDSENPGKKTWNMGETQRSPIVFISDFQGKKQNCTLPDTGQFMDFITRMKSGGEKDLPDIEITKFEVWYVIEKINEDESLITQGMNIIFSNIGNLNTDAYSLNITIYAIWPDYEIPVENMILPPGFLATGINWAIEKINWPSMEKPIQYRAEVKTDLVEETYENNVKTVLCNDGFRISGTVKRGPVAWLLTPTIPPILFIEDVNPKYSINRTAYGECNFRGQYNFTAPIRDSKIQIRTFLYPIAILGIFFPTMKFPFQCRFFSKTAVIDPPSPNEHIIVDFRFF